MEYNEDAILTRYIWDHYQHLMTDFGRGAGMACLIRMKADAYHNPDPLADAIQWLQRNQLDGDTARAAIENPHEFRDQVRDRVLDECKDGLFINRCSECRKVVATRKRGSVFGAGTTGTDCVAVIVASQHRFAAKPRHPCRGRLRSGRDVRPVVRIVSCSTSLASFTEATANLPVGQLR